MRRSQEPGSGGMMGDDDLLARMMRGKHGWGPEDLERLYLSFGRDKREGAKHTVYSHTADPLQLRATVARHSSLPIGMFRRRSG
jgi:hypothetical protein